MPNSCVQNSLAADWKENKFNFLTHSHERSGGMIFLLCLNIKTSLWLMLLLDCDNTEHKKGINLTTKPSITIWPLRATYCLFPLKGRRLASCPTNRRISKQLKISLEKKFCYPGRSSVILWTYSILKGHQPVQKVRSGTGDWSSRPGRGKTQSHISTPCTHKLLLRLKVLH